MIYHTERIGWDIPLKIIGAYNIFNNEINFTIILDYNDTTIIYKTWSRKIFGQFDQDSFEPPIEPIQKLADKFEKMGQNRFNIRFKTIASKAIL